MALTRDTSEDDSHDLVEWNIRLYTPEEAARSAAEAVDAVTSISKDQGVNCFIYSAVRLTDDGGRGRARTALAGSMTDLGKLAAMIVAGLPPEARQAFHDHYTGAL